MTPFKLIYSSFHYYWKGNLGLLFGAFLASAILSGSLVVGDSVRSSLRKAAEQRLGHVQQGLLGGDRWFTETLARDVEATPVILLQGSVSAASGQVRANAVQVMGVNDSFWKLSPANKSDDLSCVMAFGSAKKRSLQGNSETVVLNEPVARKLNVKAGDTVIIRLEKPSAISRDAPLSGSTNQEVTLRRVVASIVSPENFGSFQLTASQTGSDTVFLPLADLQGSVEKVGKINGMLASKLIDLPVSLEQKRKLEDFDLKLQRVKGTSAEWELSTDRIFLDDTLSEKILQALPKSYGVLTYLVNGFTSPQAITPNSMVTALPEEVQDSRFKTQGTGDSMVISQWLADDHQLKIGDKLDMRYFVVGVGREMTEKTASFTVSGIVPMDNADLNRAWTPNFPGVSDAMNCRDWEPGFPMKLDAIRDKDEAYWKDYNGTPKAFISMATGQKLWGNRFGKLTAIRFPDSGQDEAALRSQLMTSLKLLDIGLVPRDFKAEASAAAKGSVDFGGLFVGLSFFLIGAALVFAALLFLFTIEKRAPQIGVLLALGWTTKKVRQVVLAEAALVSFIGSALGLLGGMLYTKLALAGLNGVWSSATIGLKLHYEANPLTLVIAFFSSVLVSLGTVWWVSRRLFRAQPKDLLVGEAWLSSATVLQKNRRAWVSFIPVICLLLAMGLSYAGSNSTNPEAMAGMFFGAGFLLITAGILWVSRLLRKISSSQHVATSLREIGWRNLTRRPGRSLSVIGMMSGGIFLVIAVNAFRLGADQDPSDRASGTGGFALIGESTLPIYQDLNKEAAWDEFALDDKVMKLAAIVPFRMREGDDASCLNLNRAQRPVLTAVNASLLQDRKAFVFADGSWDRLIDKKDNAIPAIADQATALWGLGKGVGDTLTYTDAQGREFQVRLVGLLKGSLLQGKITINEDQFLAKFPDAAGYKFFLIDTPLDQRESVSAHLTKQLESRGLALEFATARLAAFQSVQNTYIGIFTVLGGLGVLLGTAGLGVLAARNILERRGEFGLMQALGFRPAALRQLVLSEHTALLVAGLLLGLIGAMIAVWPNVRQSGGALPLGFLAYLIIGILVFGIVVCWLAGVLALKGKLLDAVRRE
ncbi:FtsX-like permease family protein [soil metagenome]